MVREPVLDTVVGVEKTEKEVEEVLEVVTETRLVEVGQRGEDLRRAIVYYTECLKKTCAVCK